MAIFKCKMCGGDLTINPEDLVCTCEYCGTEQTLPKLDSEKKANLYDRANHFRRNNDYDKAMSIYEQILNEDNTDAEAYWSLILCRYGVEYVEDPASHKRVPTINRAQFTSIYADEDYKSALQYAGISQKILYEQEAKAIDEIQKGILAISEKEEPFDVFICYKETDANGRRTQDSVLANDLYHQLTQEGFKVFFSRITLEDKLGTAYEPYIFAALNSAKVMVVLGTKPEYFNAVWVKNEWSRYLSIVKESQGKKVLIPAYRDMDPYDLPEEFSHLQAQDMSKLGFMQDLIRGIKKIVSVDRENVATKETVVANGSADVAPLLKRAFLFLEDGNWDDADAYCERVLDQDPENAQAYLGKLMAELRVRRQEDLIDCTEAFDSGNNYQKIVRFGDSELVEMLSKYIDHINDRNESTRLNEIYDKAVIAMKSASSEKLFKSAAALFNSILGFKDADSLAVQCLERAEVCRKDAAYNSARSQMTGNVADAYEKAIDTFRTISGWKDADEQINDCQRKIEEIKAKEEAERLERERQAEERRIAAEKATKKRKRTIVIVVPIIVVCIAFVISLTTVIIPKQKLNKAMGLLDSGDYEAAYALLEEIGNSDAIASSKYDRAVALINSGDYDTALFLLEDLNYKDSADQIENCYIGKFGEEKYNLIKNIKIGDIYKFGSYEQDNKTTNGKEEIEWIVLEKDGMSLFLISKDALDCNVYNTSDSGVTWENCSLRTWLNYTFLNDAFSSEEQNRIINTTVTVDENLPYSTSPGNDTIDKVFLLSITEANKYFSSDEARKCSPTDYAVGKGAYKDNEDDRGCGWWLRSRGENYRTALFVYGSGSVDDHGLNVCYDFIAVRPALWINLGS